MERDIRKSEQEWRLSIDVMEYICSEDRGNTVLEVDSHSHYTHPILIKSEI